MAEDASGRQSRLKPLSKARCGTANLYGREVTMHDDEADPIAEGFRQPPRQVTDACLIYLARVNDMRSFFALFLSTVRSLLTLAKAAPDEAKQIISRTARAHKLSMMRFGRYSPTTSPSVSLSNLRLRRYSLICARSIMPASRRLPKRRQSETVPTPRLRHGA